MRNNCLRAQVQYRYVDQVILPGPHFRIALAYMAAVKIQRLGFRAHRYRFSASLRAYQ